MDFGGGVGELIPALLSNIDAKDRSRCRVVVVDSAELCEIGRRLHGDQVTFSTELPSDPVDVCLMSSVVHYLPDWRGTLRALARINPKYICIGRHLCADGAGSSTYRTVQTVSVNGVECGQAIATLFDHTQIVSLLKEAGYRLLANHLNYDAAWMFGPDVSLPFELNERTMIFRRID